MSYPHIQSNPHYVIEHFLLVSLREVKFDLYKQLQQRGINLIPAKKICSNCFTKLSSMINAKVDDITFDDVDNGMNNQDMVAIEHEILAESDKKTITNCFTLLRISPIKVHGKPFSSRKSLGKRKINSVMDAITEKVAKTLNLTKSDLDNTVIVGNEDAAKEIQEKAAQFDHLMSLIKGKVLSCKTSCEKIQYLTLCPCEWSIDKCSEYFQVSQYLI